MSLRGVTGRRFAQVLRLLGDFRLNGLRIALLEPKTYMNESGRSVAPAVRFFKVPLDRLLVIHDEVDLDLGRLQARMGGGLAGTTASARLRRRSAHRSFSGYGLVSDGPSEAILDRSPISCFRASRVRWTWTGSWRAGRTRSRCWLPMVSKRHNADSTIAPDGEDRTIGATRARRQGYELRTFAALT